MKSTRDEANATCNVLNRSELITYKKNARCLYGFDFYSFVSQDIIRFCIEFI